MNHPRHWLLPLLVLFTCCLFTQVYLWNRASHTVTGAIAYRELQQSSPQLTERVVTILRQHPEFQQRWAAKINDPTLSADDKNQYLFMLAARWRDDIRDNQYDHPIWHYANHIYAPEEGVARTNTRYRTLDRREYPASLRA